MAAVVVRRRAAHAASDVKRIPVAHEDTSGEPCFVRARTERVKGNRQSADHGASLVLELDLPTAPGHPARRFDVHVPAQAVDMRRWLSVLARGYIVDECVVTRGTWGDARLVLEDRGAGKLVLEVHVPGDAGASWTVPPEWEGAVDVTDLPAWSRPVLAAAQWPEPAIRPRPTTTSIPAPTTVNAWGAPLDPASEPCEDA